MFLRGTFKNSSRRIFFTLLREARIGAMSARVLHRFLFQRTVLLHGALTAKRRTGSVRVGFASSGTKTARGALR
jgi:hypothetical protein